jgi:hypothetical protein
MDKYLFGWIDSLEICICSNEAVNGSSLLIFNFHYVWSRKNKSQFSLISSFYNIIDFFIKILCKRCCNDILSHKFR